MPVPRARSCNACRKTKSRCSLTRPQCLRCQAKGADCIYSSEDSYGSYSHRSPTEDKQIRKDLSTGSGPSPQALKTSRGQTLGEVEQTTQISQPIENAEHNHEFLEQNLEFSQDALDDTLFQTTSWFEFPFTHFLDQSLEHITSITGLDPAAEFMFSYHDNIELAPFSVWPTFKYVPKDLPNLLCRRQTMNVGATVASNYICSVLLSYPKLLGDLHLPPIIHGSSLSLTDTSHGSKKIHLIHEPLSICATILPLLRNTTDANINFILRTLFTEIHRLHVQYRQFKDEELLCSLQALSLYVLALSTVVTTCNNLAIVLLMTSMEITSKIHDQGYYLESELSGQIPSWQEWRLYEGKRRTIMLLFLTAMVIDVEIGSSRVMNCASLNSISLPCSKSLWEADSEAEWEKQYMRYKTTKKRFGFLTFGDLRSTHGLNRKDADPALLEDLENWGKDADEFGSLGLIALGSIIDR